MLVLNQRENYGIDKIIDINKFSNLSKLYGTTTWAKRFCVNLKNVVNIRKGTILLKSFLKSSELRQAENDWIKIKQKTFEDNNKLKDLKRQLNVIVDNENLLRRERRLQYAPLPYDSKTPILINAKHKQRFWIVRGRNFVRGVLRKCSVCRRFEGKTYRYPITPPLAPLRLNGSRPFVTTGIDNVGPAYVKNVFGQSDKTHKA